MNDCSAHTRSRATAALFLAVVLCAGCAQSPRSEPPPAVALTHDVLPNIPTSTAFPGQLKLIALTRETFASKGMPGPLSVAETAVADKEADRILKIILDWIYLQAVAEKWRWSLMGDEYFETVLDEVPYWQCRVLLSFIQQYPRSEAALTATVVLAHVYGSGLHPPSSVMDHALQEMQRKHPQRWQSVAAALLIEPENRVALLEGRKDDMKTPFRQFEERLTGVVVVQDLPESDPVVQRAMRVVPLLHAPLRAQLLMYVADEYRQYSGWRDWRNSSEDRHYYADRAQSIYRRVVREFPGTRQAQVAAAQVKSSN